MFSGVGLRESALQISASRPRRRPQKRPASMARQLDANPLSRLTLLGVVRVTPPAENRVTP